MGLQGTDHFFLLPLIAVGPSLFFVQYSTKFRVLMHPLVTPYLVPMHGPFSRLFSCLIFLVSELLSIIFYRIP